MEQDKETQHLEQQLREAALATQFFEHEVGRFFVELAAKEITRLTREVTSEKYLKDHMGYVNAVTELNVWQRHLRKLQVAASPQRVKLIKDRLNDQENA